MRTDSLITHLSPSLWTSYYADILDDETVSGKDACIEPFQLIIEELYYYEYDEFRYS